LFVSEERARVTYVSRPLSDDLQVTGAPRITFYASIDQKDTNFRIQVRDADSDAIYPLGSRVAEGVAPGG
jgi:predicted acyl esterase